MGEASATDSGSITCSFAHGYWQVGRAGSQGSRRGRDRLGTQPAGGAAQVDVPAAHQPGLRDPGTCEELTGRHVISLLNRSVLSTKSAGAPAGGDGSRPGAGLEVVVGPEMRMGPLVGRVDGVGDRIGDLS